MLGNMLLSPVLSTTTDFVTTFIGLVGFVLSLAITAALIWLLRKPAAQLLEKLIGDAAIAQKIALFTFILIGLAGLYSAIGAFYPGRYGYSLFGADDKFQIAEFVRFGLLGLINLLGAYAEVLKWVIVAVAIFFVGYSLRGWGGKKEE